jgi:predicted AAA+ superfamily ATPase
VQRRPDFLPVLRFRVDRNNQPGRILILDSVSGDLLRLSSVPLVGRMETLTLRSFSLA